MLPVSLQPIRFWLRTQALGRAQNGSELAVNHKEVLNAIQQPLQCRDYSPTQEAEPCDHHGYDQCGKEVDSDPAARLRRR
jgi:hypothetical protein